MKTFSMTCHQINPIITWIIQRISITTVSDVRGDQMYWFHISREKMGAFLISTICLFEYLKSFSSCSPTWMKSKNSLYCFIIQVGPLNHNKHFFFFFQIAYLSRHWLSNWFLQIMSHSWCCSWLAPLCLMTAGLLSSGKTLALWQSQQCYRSSFSNILVCCHWLQFLCLNHCDTGLTSSCPDHSTLAQSATC